MFEHLGKYSSCLRFGNTVLPDITNFPNFFSVRGVRRGNSITAGIHSAIMRHNQKSERNNGGREIVKEVFIRFLCREN